MFKTVFWVLLVLAAIQRFWFEGREHQQAKRGIVHWGWTGYAMVTCHVLTYTGIVFEFMLDERRILNPWLSTLGVNLFLFGFLLRRWAIRTLGQHWSLQIELRPNQPLIQTGPYRYIRHPNYVALMLEVLGLPLIVNAFYTFLIVLLCYCPLIILRLIAEERALIVQFPTAYRQYQQAVGAVFPKWHHLRIHGMLSLWMGCLLGCVGCATPAYTVRPQPIPIESPEVREFERAISDAQARELERHGARVIRPGEQLWGFDIHNTVQRLSRVTERPSLVYRALLIPDRDPNAAALADGRVYVTRGMLGYLASRGSREDELAFILAHELGHTCAQHLLQRYQHLQQQNLVAGLVELGVALATRQGGSAAQGVGTLARDAVTLVGDLAISGYSQQQELEADQLGMRYCLRAGYNPQAAVAVVEDFKRFDVAMPFLRTHPYMELRAQYLRQYLQDVAAQAVSRDEQHRRLREAQRLYPPGSVSWKNLQKQLDALE